MADKLVFVDGLEDRGWRLGPNCHLLPADGTPSGLSALHAVAGEVGMKPAWFQQGRWPHYDLTAKRRQAALSRGAVEIDAKAYIRMRKIQMRGWFVEPGSGLQMILGCWYLLSDSGSYYSARGFKDPDRARKAAGQLKDYDLSPEDVAVAVCMPASPDNLGMINLCNIVKADDLLTFWSLTDPSILIGSF